MAVIARRLVSTNKRRYQEDGFDLDLTYITPRVIAMGFPCDGVSSLYRNPAGQVARLLSSRHGPHVRVYNLCAERGYDEALFGGRVMRLPMYDGQAPPLPLLLALARDAAAWLAAAPTHVVAVHCKAGKGRTGAAVCCLLLALDPDLGEPSLDRALRLYAQRRTVDDEGLTIPSQRRFVEYFHRLLLTTPLPATATATLHTSPPVHAPTGVQAAPKQPQAADPHRNGHGTSTSRDPTQIHPDPSNPDPDPASEAAATACDPRLGLADVPHRGALLQRVRFRGLPYALARDCTAAVWVRPTGHYDAYPVCLVHTGAAGAGCLSPSAASGSSGTCPRGATWAVREDPGALGGGGGGGAAAEAEAAELVLDLTSLPPPPPAPKPLPLPYYTAPDPPPPPTHPTSASPTPTAAPGAGAGVPFAGDVKIQLFRGRVIQPDPAVFKGRVSQMAVWISSSFLDPRSSAAELGRAQLDKLAKPLRRWRGELGVAVEYRVLP